MHSPYEWKMAYTIQTSGTTGYPKIVRVPHRCIVPNIQSLQSVLSVRSSDVIFLASPFTFDPSIIEMFLALSAGALLLIVTNAVKSSPCLLLKVLFSEVEHRVTVLEATPSFVMRWSLEEMQSTLLCERSSLRVLVLGGEPCPSVQVLEQWKSKQNKTEIFNVYGITEVSCWATVHKVVIPDVAKSFDHNDCGTHAPSQQDPVPLGNALSQTLLAVKDESGEEVFTGEGELYIGSMDRVCLVDSETVQNLQFPVYRATGDIVKIDGSSRMMIYLGRKDNIIKRFGHKVSLNHVERVVATNRCIEQSCCVWEPHIKKLGLFVKVEQNKRDDKQFLRALKFYLVKHLQPSSIPDVIMELKSFPLSCHGKLDHCELKCLLRDKVQEDVIELNKLGDIYQVFASLWSHYLCMESHPNPQDNFLQAGGNSIQALQLVSELEEVFGSSAHTSLIGSLLGGSTYEECCSCLSSSCERKLENISIDASKQLIQKYKCRKRLTSSQEGDAVKYLRVEQAGISSVDSTEVQKVDCDKNIHTSSCRGRTEGFGVWTEPCVFSSLNDIKLRVRWKYNLEKCVDASPCFIKYKSGDERVLIGSHSHLFVIIHSRTAELIAECKLMDRIESSVCVSPCGRFGVVGSYDGCVYCINLHTGEIKWSFHTGGLVKSSPALCLNGSAIVVGSYDRFLYCISILDGHLIWSAKLEAGSIFSSPCVAKAVYAATLDGTCYSLDEDSGHFLWTRKLESPVFSSPALIQDESAVLFAEVSGTVHCFSVTEGKELWNFQADGNIFSSFCIQPSMTESSTNLILFGCHDKKLYCLESSENTVSLRWTCVLDSSIFSTPFLFPVVISSEDKYSGNTLETFKSDRQIVKYLVAAASTKGIVYVLDLDFGIVECSYQLPGEVFSSPVVNRNNIYVGCRDNHVYSLAMRVA
ncbi:beta-alanine-activating enzyme isoform X4 [Cryptotermes secundus]|nr:beta-alanine-activating enzyme isoform X4 [Cryptotermes secundus]